MTKNKSERPKIPDNLLRDARNRGLVLFVGSGINGNKVPTWSELLGRLMRQAGKNAAVEDGRVRQKMDSLLAWCKNNFDSMAQASLVKQILGPQQYRLELQKLLYENSVTKSPLLDEIARLCESEYVRAVVTFNYDTHLEDELRKNGRVTPFSITNNYVQPANISKDGEKVLPVFHVHGLISSPASALKAPKEDIVLDYEEYFERDADALSWETATPIHLLRNHSSLWIGASLKDWDMLRLLYAAKDEDRGIRSFCLQCLEGISPKRANAKLLDRVVWRTSAMRFRATLFNAVGLGLVVGGSEYTDLPNWLRCFREDLKPEKRRMSSHANRHVKKIGN